MSDLIPVFSTHYGMDFSSLLTLEETGKSKPGAPISICDLAKAHSLKHVVMVDPKIDGFNEAYKNLQKAGISQLVYGVKMCVCADATDKSDDSLKTESNVIIFIRSTQGYSDLIKIYNRAWTDGFHHKGRTDWRQLKDLWTPNLALALPFFSSFIARNLLTLSNIVPDFPVPPTLFREVDSGLPFAALINDAVTQFAASDGLSTQDIKTVYYRDYADMDAYSTFRAIGNRSEFQRPNVDHMCSDRFCMTDYLRLAARTT